MLILVLGASALATTAVLTAIFFGMGLGSWLGAKWLRRVSNEINFLSLMIFVIGFWGLMVGKILYFVSLIGFNFLQTEASGAMFFLSRFVVAVMVVLPATSAMGAIVPTMNRILMRYTDSVGEGVSLAYGVNVCGSVLGALMAGFVLIPVFGVKGAVYVTCSVNILMAIALWVWSYQNFKIPLGEKAVFFSKELQPENLRKKNVTAVFVGVYFCAAFLSLGYEIVWLRILGIVLSNSVITLTAALSIYLLGFSLGSLVLYPLLAEKIKPSQIFTLSNWGAGFTTICLIPLYYNLGNLNLEGLFVLMSKFNVSQILIVHELLICFLAMFIPTLFLGLAYPAVCGTLIGKKEEIARMSGNIFSFGAFASGLGVAVVGLMFIPKFNLMLTLAILCISSLLLCLLILKFADDVLSSNKLFFRWTACLFIIIAAVFGMGNMPFVEEGHIYAKGDHWVYKDKGSDKTTSLLRYESGTSGTVTVEEVKSKSSEVTRYISVDFEKVAASHFWALVDAKLLAHIPLLLHPNPQNAITVGFGSGVTSWSMTRYGIDVDCVDIEPEVVNSAVYFKEHNHGVLEEPNFNIIINDARNYFYVEDKKYDVISTDATNLQYKQNATLYTKEYFQLLKSRLKEGGIVSAWVPMGGVNDMEFKILLKTFKHVFNHTSVWLYEDQPEIYYAIFVGTPEPLKIDYTHITEMMSDPAIKKDFAEINIDHPDQLISFLFMDEIGAEQYIGDVPLHTDDKLVLEFFKMTLFDGLVDFEKIKRYRIRDHKRHINF